MCFLAYRAAEISNRARPGSGTASQGSPTSVEGDRELVKFFSCESTVKRRYLSRCVVRALSYRPYTNITTSSTTGDARWYCRAGSSTAMLPTSAAAADDKLQRMAASSSKCWRSGPLWQVVKCTRLTHCESTTPLTGMLWPGILPSSRRVG